MSLEQMLLVGAAAVVALWPGLKGAVEGVVAAVRKVLTRPSQVEVVPAIPAAGAAGDRPSFQAAIANLALVRSRLSQTELLDEPTKKAIDTLTLALVAGSDK